MLVLFEGINIIRDERTPCIFLSVDLHSSMFYQHIDKTNFKLDAIISFNNLTGSCLQYTSLVFS
uniref:Uncharacterized protein n=1 Tax=Arundo donax TaxID=35708 RepID=A0A0A9G7X6_ARUDO